MTVIINDAMEDYEIHTEKFFDEKKWKHSAVRLYASAWNSGGT
jgi:hypothetical protein